MKPLSHVVKRYAIQYLVILIILIIITLTIPGIIISHYVFGALISDFTNCTPASSVQLRPAEPQLSRVQCTMPGHGAKYLRWSNKLGFGG